MDLQLYSRVLWRFRYLVGAGLLVAIVLALFSFVRIGFDGASPHLSYRASEQWSADTTLFVTQSGFPDGRTVPEYTQGTASQPPAPVADSARMTGLAFLYSQLVSSDAVKARMAESGPIDGAIQASAATDPNTGATSPLITITATAATGPAAVSLARRAAAAFREFIQSQQIEAAIPPGQRVLVKDVTQPASPQLLSGRKKTVPAVVFLTVMIAVIGLAFVLENLRPQVRIASFPQTRQARSSRRRRSA